MKFKPGNELLIQLLKGRMVVLVAQWIERPPDVREVMGLIPVGDSDFLFIPR